MFLDLKIVTVSVDQLKPDPRNARTHSAKQITQLIASIKEFGFTSPILCDGKFSVIAGHGRLEAARKLGVPAVACIVIDHLSDAQKLALAIADNKIALNAGWDRKLLADTLIVLSDPDIQLIEAIGFETAEVDIIVASDDRSADPDDTVPEPIRTNPSITQLGSLTMLGPHRIYCGDALDPMSYASLLGDEVVDQVVSDPPYNRNVDDIGNLGRVKHPQFAQASGEMSEGGFQSFLDTGHGLAKLHSRDGAMLMIFMDFRHLHQVLAMGRTLDLELKGINTWDKINAGMGSLYRGQTEFIAIFKAGKGKHVNNIMLGKLGRYRTTLWRYAGATMFSRTRTQDLAAHPTVKPIAMIMDAILDCSNRNDIVLDPFGGSGTTLLAAERTARRARLIELDPYYVDVTVARWRKLTGGSPVVVAAPRQEEFAK